MIEQLLFWVFAILTCGAAVAVVATQNVVRMAFWLIVSLGSVSALFFLLHADFLGAAQLLIYVGGTVVLLVFGVMLTASGPSVLIKTSPAEAFVGAGVGLLLLCVLLFSVTSVEWNDIESRLPTRNASPAVVDSRRSASAEAGVVDAAGSPELGAAAKSQAALMARTQAGRTVRQLGLGFLGLRPDRDLRPDGTRNSPANGNLASGYLLPFEIVSIHLLVVLVGAAYLARAKRRAAVGSSADL